MKAPAWVAGPGSQALFDAQNAARLRYIEAREATLREPDVVAAQQRVREAESALWAAKQAAEGRLGLARLWAEYGAALQSYNESKRPLAARPIEPTPPVEGEDAERLLASLKTGASDAEMAKRAEAARERIARMTAPKER